MLCCVISDSFYWLFYAEVADTRRPSPWSKLHILTWVKRSCKMYRDMFFCRLSIREDAVGFHSNVRERPIPQFCFSNITNFFYKLLFFHKILNKLIEPHVEVLNNNIQKKINSKWGTELSHFSNFETLSVLIEICMPIQDSLSPPGVPRALA